jgi:hypothetical protein
MIGNSWLIKEESLRSHMASIAVSVITAPTAFVAKVALPIAIPNKVPSSITAASSSRLMSRGFFATTLVSMVVVSALIVMRSTDLGIFTSSSDDQGANIIAATGVPVPSNSGIAVVPSTGNVATDAALREKIAGSFSDQVNVAPDKSGTAGVITPVFKKTDGKGFLYVMVPVKSAKSP